MPQYLRFIIQTLFTMVTKGTLLKVAIVAGFITPPS